ncbi:hypothetical protein BU16DRAFT_616261 [Lophium mytilinum]|uniref:Uncharacterized protein n=1 Tax=Lophium mytilinum TaxID=390894 RepID=A0A6A6R1E2_9PEZI|nr:hypothetical protein BU16DRAFT_616261 [Lophium mytilinum]
MLAECATLFMTIMLSQYKDPWTRIYHQGIADPKGVETLYRPKAMLRNSGMGRETAMAGGYYAEMGEGLPYGDEGLPSHEAGGSEEGELRAAGTTEEEKERMKLREAEDALNKIVGLGQSP